MAKVDTSDPWVTVTVVSDAPAQPDGALTADLLADFALTLAEQHLPGDTPILCTHAPEGHLGGLWAQGQVPYAPPVTDEPQAEPEPTDALCPAPDCGHPAGRHISHNARGQDAAGCRDCACMRSRERVARLAESACATS